MFFKNRRLQERKAAEEILKEIVDNRRKINVIHYSCESFYETNNTPRITAICVKNTDNNSSSLFSIHLEAQIKKRPICCLNEQDFDYLEKSMLERFYKYVKENKTKKWVHWNMRNSVYGFDAIEIRFRILGGKPENIESQFRYDLSDIVPNLYTDKYEDRLRRGRLLNLANRNNITDRDALAGAEEAAAFNQKDYQKLSLSTSRKVDIIDSILSKVINGKLKTAASVYAVYGLSLPGLIEIVKNNLFLSVVFSVIVFILGVIFEDVVKAFFGIR